MELLTHGIGHLVDYWQRETHLRLVGEDLLGAVNTPGNAAATLDKAHQREDTYIKIVPAGLRARSAADDDTLFPLRDGRVDEQPAAGPPEYLLACAAEAAVVAGTADEYEDDDVDAQVVTVLSFTTFTGEGGSAELFARAAEYLETHPRTLRWPVSSARCRWASLTRNSTSASRSSSAWATTRSRILPFAAMIDQPPVRRFR